MTEPVSQSFSDLSLSAQVLEGLNAVGYESPSPIQAQTIPLLLQGKDMVGQAQTGTGKTAAFALPILCHLDLSQRLPQALVLAPTRELAIQVAEAFQTYASKIPGFRVLPVYGGQDYKGQIRALERGVHVVVGTPGRIMDHMRRGTLKLSALKNLVLDEADEMLRMGFIDDVEWILSETPPTRQIALFSATMPAQIRRIAEKHLKDPATVTVKLKTTTAATIRQRYWPVRGMHKLDALTRILEAEPFDAMIVFVRTKVSTVELAEKLEARGFRSAALNGDIPQNQRERSINQLKQGKVDILVATDVAARGLDVERVSHVINFDVPYDTEAYVHRIGRTGRAGRQGDAILFVAPRERRMLHAIEKATRQRIEIMDLPSTADINDKRRQRFLQKIDETLAAAELGEFIALIETYQQERNVPALEIAAALAVLVQGDSPLLVPNKPQRKSEPFVAETGSEKRHGDKRKDSPRKAGAQKDSFKKDGADKGSPRKDSPRKEGKRKDNGDPPEGYVRYRVEVGHNHEMKPGNLVGAIANEAGLEGEFIGRIDIRDDHSRVDLPDGMPADIYHALKKTRVAGQALKITRLDGQEHVPESRRAEKKPSKPRKKKPAVKKKPKD